MTELNIQDVLAWHLVGQDTIPLVEAPSKLSLLSSPQLTLTLGSALAWPLGPKTIFGTQTGNPRGYFLKPDLGDETVGWVKLELPESAVSDGSRDKLETLLVARGLLNSGPSAGDDLAAALKTQAAKLSDSIDAGLASLKSEPATSQPATFSSSTHSTLETLAAGSATAASFVNSAATTVFSLTAAAGSALGSAVGLKGDPTPEGDKSEIRKDIESAFSEGKQVAVDAGAGLVDATSQVYTKATGAASEAITHTQGPEAAQVAQKAGETTENAGSVAKDVFLGTSAMEHARVAGVGAVQKD